jgi:hypothetical protein
MVDGVKFGTPLASSTRAVEGSESLVDWEPGLGINGGQELRKLVAYA